MGSFLRGCDEPWQHKHRQAICRKEDPRWHAYGIPTVFYSDHGSDFTSKHMEQVAADLPMELIFSQVSIPRGRGKIERFFRSVDQLLLQDTPGYAPKGSTRGNIRLIERLMTQVEHILVANPAVSVVTKEAVETARENLIIGLN